MKRLSIYSVKQIKEKGALYELDHKFVRSPEDMVHVVNEVLDLSNDAAEKFGILTLTTKNEVAGVHVLSMGSLNASIIHPREVFKAAILNNASSIVCFHNHPSGDPAPSQEDIMVTKRLLKASEIIGIDLLDHVVFGDGRFCSLKEKGYM